MSQYPPKPDLQAGEPEAKPEQPPKYGRTRCKNCDKRIPKTKVNRKFCDDACRKEFHHHGSAFGPLRIKLEKMIAVAVKDLKVQLAAINARVKRLEAR